MKLTLQNTANIGKPCKLFDANGNEIPYPIECDTETGVCVHYCLDEKGAFIVDENYIRRAMTVFPAPIQVEWIDVDN